MAALDACDQVADASVQHQKVRGKLVVLVALHETSYTLCALHRREFLRIGGKHIPESDKLKDSAVSVDHVLVYVGIQV